jgi:uncharacterized protein (TIGR02301 family)
MLALPQGVASIEAQELPAEPPAQTGDAAAAPPPDTDEPAPFDTDMARLSNVLGALHYLRNICGETGNEWRIEMDALLTDGRYEGERRKRMTAAFNDGYRAFSGTYFTCSPRAAAAAEEYRREGAALAANIVSRFRN